MTSITITTDDDEHPTAPGLGTSFVASFSEYCAGARDGKEIEARYRRLSRMSNSELADIGLTRADIYRAALLGRPV